MNFDETICLKWIEVDHPHARSIDFTVFNMCALILKDTQDNVLAFTVFYPRDFNDSFKERFFERHKKANSKEVHFVLQIPSFLMHRYKTLFSNISGEIPVVKCSPYLKVKWASNRFEIENTIRVVNVDDSQVLLKFLKFNLESTGFISVVGQVSESENAVRAIRQLQPDIVTMDIQMPIKNGVEVVKDLLEETYFPVIMISSLSIAEGTLVFEALKNGAFDYLQKPKLEERDAFKEEIVEKMLLAMQGRKKSFEQIKNDKKPKSILTSIKDINFQDFLWCLGSSTGGTQALTEIFTTLPSEIPPTLIVQHIPPVFSRSFAESLNQLCPFLVKEAEPDDLIKPNCVYIAPGGLQMGVVRKGSDLYIRLEDSEPINRFKPSVDYLFSQVAKLDNVKVIAGVLTGMGKDGAEGLLNLRKNGAKTFAQDENSSIVYGMPRAAQEMGAAESVLPLDEIAHALLVQSASFRKVY